MLDDVLDVSGPAERTGKPRGTDLLDGTVTLPLILARRRDPRPDAIWSPGLSPARAEEMCDRIVDDRSAGAGARRRRSATLPRPRRSVERLDLEAERKRALELVADGVVERYA